MQGIGRIAGRPEAEGGERGTGLTGAGQRGKFLLLTPIPG